MEKLNFLVEWGKSKERAWSGTNYSLYNSLSENFEIKEKNLSAPFVLMALFKILRVHWFNSSFYLNLFNRLRCKYVTGKVFQFSEIKNNNEYCKTFIYQDLSCSYIKFMKENCKSVFIKSGYEGINGKLLEKRISLQNDYYKNCSAIFTMGRWLKKFLISQGIPKEKIFAVGGGTNVKYIQSKKNKTGNKILFIGRDFERKGGFVTYKAFCLLKARMPDVQLYIAGPKINPIENSVEGVHFLGDVKYEKLTDLYNLCDIFCMPSFFEAYGLVFVEALIFGLPCIGRNCYEMPYFIEDNKTGYLLSENGNEKELAEKMELALKNHELKKNVALKHDYYINEYSWKSVAERIKNVIEKF